jgi:hypothetical protein
MLTEKIFATFGPGDNSVPLPALCRRLIEQQAGSWPMLAEGRAALERAVTRRIECAGFDVVLQFNPRRIVSTGAKVDPASLKARRCFLCPGNLPPEQQGVLYSDHFLILCNPAPIFDGHLTISSVVHEPQALRPWISTMLSLAIDLSPAYTVLYNGPRCGASAPDHLHFQSAPFGTIPVEKDLETMDRWGKPVVVGEVSVARARDYGREVILVAGASARETADVLGKLLYGLPPDPENASEPMVNVMASHRDGKYRILVFPRRKHRPDVYFLEDERKITVSPAIVDIGGLIITPVEKDFINLAATDVESIYGEVSSTKKETEDAVEKLR